MLINGAQPTQQYISIYKEEKVCDKARKRLAALIKKNGQDDTEIQKMEIICDEFKNTNKSVNEFRAEVKNEISDLKTDVKKNSARTKCLEDRMTAVEGIVTESQKLTVETHSMVNQLFKKWNESNLEQDSALMSLIRATVSTKAGKTFAIILLGCFGLALAYIAEHIPQLMAAFS